MIHGLSIFGDVFWILALAMMAGFSWTAGKRMAPDTQVPFMWDRQGAVARRLPRLWALATLPALAFVLSAALKFQSNKIGLDTEGAVLTLGVRVVLAALVALFHIMRVQRALNVLRNEGQLKP